MIDTTVYWEMQGHNFVFEYGLSSRNKTTSVIHNFYKATKVCAIRKILYFLNIICCIKSVQIRSFSGPYFPVFRRKTEFTP